VFPILNTFDGLTCWEEDSVRVWVLRENPKPSVRRCLEIETQKGSFSNYICGCVYTSVTTIRIRFSNGVFNGVTFYSFSTYNTLFDEGAWYRIFLVPRLRKRASTILEVLILSPFNFRKNDTHTKSYTCQVEYVFPIIQKHSQFDYIVEFIKSLVMMGGGRVF